MYNLQNKKVLITGGMGFIGSTIADYLVRDGAQVTIVDSLIPEYGGNLFNIDKCEKHVRVNISDVRDPYSFRQLVQGIDYLFNLAGQTSHLDSMEDPFSDLEINCRSQLAILETCRKYNPKIKIVFASTRQIYGKPDYLPVDEKHLLRPVDVNGVNKMAGEWYHILYNNVYDIKACALRLTNVYGPRMRIKDARQTFLGIWIKQILQGKPIEIWGGEQIRDFTYVDDAVNAFILAASNDESNGKIYNVGGYEKIRLVELASLLIKINNGGNFLIKEFPKERKKIDIGDYFSDDNLIRTELGWIPKVSLEEGLRYTMDYYKSNLVYYL